MTPQPTSQCTAMTETLEKPKKTKTRIFRITFAISVINLDLDVLGEISKREAVGGRQHELGRHQGAEASLGGLLSLHVDRKEEENKAGWLCLGLHTS